MATIDIRNNLTGTVDCIQFADVKFGNACYLTRTAFGNIFFEDGDRDCENYCVMPADFDNLIAALQKAKELGWF